MLMSRKGFAIFAVGGERAVERLSGGGTRYEPEAVELAVMMLWCLSCRRCFGTGCTAQEVMGNLA